MRRLLVLVVMLAVLALALWVLPSRSAGRPVPEPEHTPAVAAPRVEPAPLDPASTLPARSEVAAPVAWFGEDAAGTGFRGRLVEHDGVPVANTEVGLLQLFPELLFADDLRRASRTHTAADGTFTVRGAHVDALHFLAVDSGGPRGTARVVERRARQDEIVDLGDVALEPTAELRGRVTSSSGDPVEGVRVRACAYIEGLENVRLLGGETRVLDRQSGRLQVLYREYAGLLERAPVPTTLTDADGRFRLRAPLGRIGLFLDHRAHPRAFEGPLELTRDGRDLGDLRLPARSSVSGRVVDAEGRPAPGAELLAGVELDSHAVLEPAGHADGVGRFQVSLPADRGAGLVAARVARGSWTAVRTEAGARELVVRLAPALSLTVEVRDLARRPLDEATVEIDRWDELPFLAAAERIFAQRVGPGVYSVTGLAPGSYSAFASASGREPAETRVEVGRRDESGALVEACVELVLVPGLPLTVEVVRADDRAPVSGARVRIVHADFLSLDTLATVTTDATGSARFAVSPDKAAGFLSSGARLVVDHPSHPRADLPLPDEERCVVALQPFGAIEGRVSFGGAPPEEPLFVRASLPERDDELTFDLTEPDGTFRIGRLEAGSYVVSVGERFLQGDALRLLARQIEGGGEPDWITERTVDVVASETVRLEIDLAPRRARVRPAGAGSAE